MSKSWLMQCVQVVATVRTNVCSVSTLWIYVHVVLCRYVSVTCELFPLRRPCGDYYADICVCLVGTMWT